MLTHMFGVLKKFPSHYKEHLPKSWDLAQLHDYLLCDLGQVASPLWATVPSSKAGKDGLDTP